jgi:hypothetical protein
MLPIGQAYDLSPPYCQPLIVGRSIQPFRGLKPGIFLDSDADYLELIDGGSNLENIPLGPLFVRARGLDVVVAVEGSAAGVNNWPECALVPPLNPQD